MLTPESFVPLLTAGLETALNRLLYRDRSLKVARQRLTGKVLTIRMQEFSHPLVLIFSDQQLDVLSDWQGDSDCTVTTRFSASPALRDRQRLTGLIRNGELDVEGDLQIVQQFSQLLDMAELDPAEYLAPWIGDIAAHDICQKARRALNFVRGDITRKQHYFTEALTEEWRMIPARLEIAWFCEEVDAISRSLDTLTERLARLEAK